NEEGGIDPLEFRFHAMTDRVATTGTAWLGLTLGCAQCHTHKYDPIQQREYYGVMAFLNNADEPELELPEPGADERQRQRLEQARQRLAALPGELPLETRRWIHPPPTAASTRTGGAATLLADASVLFPGDPPDHETYTLTLDTDLESLQTLRLETLLDDHLPRKGPGRTPHGNFVLTEIRVRVAPRDRPAEAVPVKLAAARADVEQPGYPAAHAVDGRDDTGWAVDVGARLNRDHWLMLDFDRPVSHPGGLRLVVELDHRLAARHLIGRARLGLAAPDDDPRPLAERSREEAERRFARWLEEQRARTVPWTILTPHSLTSNLPHLAVQADGSVLTSGDISKSDTYELKFRLPAGGFTALRLEALPDPGLPGRGPGLAYYEGPRGDFFLGEMTAAVDGRAVRFAEASHSHAGNNFGDKAGAALAIDGDLQTGWSTAGRLGERHSAVFNLAEPVRSGSELVLRLTFGRHYACPLGRFRVSLTPQGGAVRARDLSEEAEAMLAVPPTLLGDAARQQLREAFLLGLPEFAQA
ncbi:MAG: DUF1549 domain-containing protein, partial [Verrucomicrobiota bacterium]